jgi:hypothetical protein
MSDEMSDFPMMDDETETSDIPDIPWSEDHENILIDWADKAMCYRWLHSRSNQHYSKMNTWFTIPVIIMSTLTGTANFAQDKFPEDYREYAPMMIGAVNLFAGILTTIQQFLKVGELNEAHRVSSISWDKFYRNIKVELSKNPKERLPVVQILKLSKEEFDRLMETSPVISDTVIKSFKETFSGVDKKNKTLNEDNLTLFKELKKPEICDSLESTRKSVYKAKPTDKKFTNVSNNMIELIKKKKDTLEKEKKVEDFIKHFIKEYTREPTTEEIYENLQDDITHNIITSVINDAKNKQELNKTKETDEESKRKKMSFAEVSLSVV